VTAVGRLGEPAPGLRRVGVHAEPLSVEDGQLEGRVEVARLGRPALDRGARLQLPEPAQHPASEHEVGRLLQGLEEGQPAALVVRRRVAARAREAPDRLGVAEGSGHVEGAEGRLEDRLVVLDHRAAFGPVPRRGERAVEGPDGLEAGQPAFAEVAKGLRLAGVGGLGEVAEHRLEGGVRIGDRPDQRVPSDEAVEELHALLEFRAHPRTLRDPRASCRPEEVGEEEEEGGDEEQVADGGHGRQGSGVTGRHRLEEPRRVDRLAGAPEGHDQGVAARVEGGRGRRRGESTGQRR
jgi:hypothetical protein